MKSPAILACITAALGAAAAALVWWNARTVEDRSIRQRFETEAAGWRNAVADQMDHFISVLDSIRHLHNLSDRISAEDFAEFVSKGMRYQQETLGVFGFAQEVTREGRAEFERQPLGAGVSASAIIETAPGGALQPATARERYYPMLYLSPERGLDLPRGYDLGSDPANFAAIERMRKTGAPALGISLLGADGTDVRLVFSPILVPQYSEEDKAYYVHMRGFAFALLRPDELLRRAMPTNSTDKVNAVLSPGSAPWFRSSSDDEPSYEGSLSVADELWLFRCAAGDGYLAAHRSRQPATLFLSGLIIAALLALQVYHLSGATRRTEAIVRQRTEELRREIAERRRLQEEILDVSAREQQRLGRDLHDSLGQKLAGAVFLSKALAQQDSGSAADTREQAGHLNEILKESVAQVRLIARGLSPVEVGEDGLAHALRRLADETTGIFSVACSFSSSGSQRALDTKASNHLYLIAQEAVNNAIRHGQAKDVTIRLTADRLVVEDNGAGFDSAKQAVNGMGLRIMQYRAEMIGGRLDIESHPGKGTRISCALLNH
jgi:signal transduction histidine kinase